MVVGRSKSRNMESNKRYGTMTDHGLARATTTSLLLYLFASTRVEHHLKSMCRISMSPRQRRPHGDSTNNKMDKVSLQKNACAYGAHHSYRLHPTRVVGKTETET